MRRVSGCPALLALCATVLVACGGRLTPPDVPPERREIDRLARAQLAGELAPVDRRRLAVLLDRYDNAPERADLLDEESPTTRARQAVAWRAWARQRPGWTGFVVRAIVADPADAGGAALAALLHDDAAVAAHRAALDGARTALRPITRCLIDGLWTPAGGAPCAADALQADLDAALAELAAADPQADPEADRLRWTLAHSSPSRSAQAAAAAARWIERWPRHADGWAMAGASAAVDPTATAAERLAWSGAVWHRAVGLQPGNVRARLALADLETRHGFADVADAHRLAAQQAVGHTRPLPESWARGPDPWLPQTSALPGPATAAAIIQSTERRGAPVPSLLLDRTVLVFAEDGPPMIEIQRLSTRPFRPAAGCLARRHGPKPTIHEQACRHYAVPVEGAFTMPFPTARAAAMAEIAVFTPQSRSPRVESHGGAPGARVIESAEGAIHVFTLDDIEPARDARRRPRVKVRLASATTVPRPEAHMVDRLVALGPTPPAVAGDPRRTVARLRAAGVEAEQGWVARDGQPIALWARRRADGWAWFDGAGRPWSGDAPLVAATRDDWVGRSPAAIARAPGGDLPSSQSDTASSTDPKPAAGRP